MSTFASRTVITVLAIVLSGVLDSGLLLAQTQSQAPAASTPDTQTQPAAPSGQPAQGAPSSPQTQAPPQPDQQQQPDQHQQQEDKASQGLINGTPESGTQVPESPDTVRARQEAAQQAQQPTTAPAGTAAAEGARPAGAIASRPAGAAIAPANQHRVRSFLIKFGAIAGAGAAIGTVYGLSRASGPKPPGAR